MAENDEITALTAVDKALSDLADDSARERVLRWAWQKYVSKAAPGAASGDSEPVVTPRKKGGRGISKPARPLKAKRKASLAVVNELNLKPSGKKAFAGFANEKQPKSNQQKFVVSIYYLREELRVPKIGADHVYTCFKHMGWRVPANLVNALQVTASVNGWIDTADMSDIKLTAKGENLVDHDLPSKPSAKK